MGIEGILRRILLLGQGMDEAEKRRAFAVVIESLSKALNPELFTYSASHHAFRKSELGYRSSFNLNVFMHADSFTIRPTGSVRHDDIEAIYHEVAESPASVRKEAGTIPWEWAVQRREVRKTKIHISRNSGVPGAVAFCERFFRSYCKPFFEEHGDVKSISDSLNNNQRIANANLGGDWFGLLCRAIIAARLAGRDDYEALKHSYRAIVIKRGMSEAVELYDKLAGHLANRVAQ